MAVPSAVQAISDPVERTRAFMDSVATRWQNLRNLGPPVTEAQFWLDTAGWETYYQLRRGGAFGINANDWQGAWDDTLVWDSKLEEFELQFLGAASGPNAPTKPGAVDPTKEDLDPTGSIAEARSFPWAAAGLVAVVVIGGVLILREV